MKVKKIMIKKTSPFFVFVLAVLTLAAVLASAGTAFAAAAAMPWEAALVIITNSLTGPVALGISLIAIVAAGAALIFGGDMTGFMRTAVYLVLVIGLIVSAAGILKSLYGKDAPTSNIIIEQSKEFLA
ncbi:hypothetical protein FACS1894204_04370 [Synergistales bacterium]|nr:hypothetical protein FACS1894204_04370 [Synergistales bacterium]